MFCCMNNNNNKNDRNSLQNKINFHNNLKSISEFKIVILGDLAVGKSSIANRYIQNTFSDKYVATIGASFYAKNIKLSNNELIKIHIWDTGGSERFRSISNIYYKGADGALLIYDVQKESTLTNLNYWIKELKDKVDSEGLVLGLAGNKIDINENARVITFNKGKEFAHKNGIKIFKEISAKSGIGVEEFFHEIAYNIFKNKQNNILKIEYDTEGF